MNDGKERLINLNINEYSLGGGNVNITVMQKDKIMRKINAHNNGTVAMCQYLRNALAGDYVSANRPGIIVPCSKGPGGSLVDIGQGSPLLTKLPKKSNETDDYDSNSSYCTLSFLIPGNQLGVGTQISGFRLYSGQTKTLFAEVNLEDRGVAPIEVISGTNLKVDWTLIVKLVLTGGE